MPWRDCRLSVLVSESWCRVHCLYAKCGWHMRSSVPDTVGHDREEKDVNRGKWRRQNG